MMNEFYQNIFQHSAILSLIFLWNDGCTVNSIMK